MLLVHKDCIGDVWATSGAVEQICGFLQPEQHEDVTEHALKLLGELVCHHSFKNINVYTVFDCRSCTDSCSFFGIKLLLHWCPLATVVSLLQTEMWCAEQQMLLS